MYDLDDHDWALNDTILRQARGKHCHLKRHSRVAMTHFVRYTCFDFDLVGGQVNIDREAPLEMHSLVPGGAPSSANSPNS
jgi:hypothetical protein